MAVGNCTMQKETVSVPTLQRLTQVNIIRFTVTLGEITNALSNNRCFEKKMNMMRPQPSLPLDLNAAHRAA